MAIAIDKLQEEFGAEIDWNEDPEVTQANLADAILVRNNPDRLQFTVINLGASNIFLRPSQAATLTTGILLVPNGGSFIVNVKDDGPLSIIEWHVVGAADNIDLFTLEIIGIKAL